MYCSGFNDGKLKRLVTGFQYGINAGVGWFVDGGLVTDFYGYANEITLGIDEGIELDFSGIYI